MFYISTMKDMVYTDINDLYIAIGLWLEILKFHFYFIFVCHIFHTKFKLQ